MAAIAFDAFAFHNHRNTVLHRHRFGETAFLAFAASNTFVLYNHRLWRKGAVTHPAARAAQKRRRGGPRSWKIVAAMKTGIFGGTFNPPHIGHLHIANCVKKKLGLDRVFFIPVNVPPHKMLERDAASPRDRLEMTKRLAGCVEGACALSVELERDGPSYTSDTLIRLSDSLPSDELWLILGSDMFFTLDRWHEAGTVLRLASVAVLPREEGDRGKLFDYASFLEEKYGARICILDDRTISLSSTLVRERIRSGGGKDLVPPGVWEYIKNRGLYVR